eukprot:GEMP01023768.1.p1 GENE.GEMP01023768.1~~GEMP01023768.1.p1  ORF type:complete len:408 (+),score=53.90 GEMP01023768.1:124-1347(+)
MPLFSNAFWQQEIPQSQFPLWFIKRKVGIGCSLVCGFLHFALGGFTLLIMQTSFEVSRSYDFRDNGNVWNITIPKEMTPGPVYMHAELEGIYTNYRTFTISKDDWIAGVGAVNFKCKLGETMQDFVYIRGTEFFENPPTRYVNEDGFFNASHPIRDLANGIDNLATTTIQVGDFLRHRASTSANWIKVTVDADNLDSVKALTSSIIQGNATTPRPCGLNSYSMFFDYFSLTDAAGQAVELDETDIAWQSDIDFVKEEKTNTIPLIKGLHLSPNDPDTGGVITMGDPKNSAPYVISWLKGTVASDGVKRKDAPFQRLLAWYRNFATPSFRMLLGKYDELKEGTYELKFVYVDKVFDNWNVKRKIVLSKLSLFGTGNLFVPVLCFAVGVIQFGFALVFTFYKKNKNKAA